jgi:hypothetical protein
MINIDFIAFEDMIQIQIENIVTTSKTKFQIMENKVQEMESKIQESKNGLKKRRLRTQFF